jgi:hypothetical protein
VITGLPNTGTEVPVTAQVTEIDTSALDGIATDTAITVTATMVGAETVIALAGGVNNAVTAIPDSHITQITEVGAAGVIGVAGGVNNAITAIPDSHTTSITVTGAQAAIGQAGGVTNAINAIPSSKTITISTINRTVFETIGRAAGGNALGGIPELATGGITARMGELGPELLRFANGGSAWAPFDQTYLVPEMTYVRPAHANAPGMGGVTFGDINVYAGDRAGIKAVFRTEIIPEIIESIDQRYASAGGRR